MANPRHQGRNAPRPPAPAPAAPAPAPEAPAAATEAVTEAAEMPESGPVSELDTEASAESDAAEAGSAADAPAAEPAAMQDSEAEAEAGTEVESGAGDHAEPPAPSEPAQPGPDFIVTVAEQPQEEVEAGGLIRLLERAAEDATAKGDHDGARAFHAAHIRLVEFAHALNDTLGRLVPHALARDLGALRRLIH